MVDFRRLLKFVIVGVAEENHGGNVVLRIYKMIWVPQSPYLILKLQVGDLWK